jgi:hypothetical protein
MIGKDKGNEGSKLIKFQSSYRLVSAKYGPMSQDDETKPNQPGIRVIFSAP